MSATPTEDSHDPTFKEINLSAEIKKALGPDYNKPEIEYEFGDRKFYRKTEHAAIYSTSPDF